MRRVIWFFAAITLVSGGLAIVFSAGLAGRQQDASMASLFALAGALLFVANLAAKRFFLL